MAHSFQLAHAPVDSFQGGVIANQKLTAGFEKGVLPCGRFRDGVLARFQCGIIYANAGKIWRQWFGVPGRLLVQPHFYLSSSAMNSVAGLDDLP